MLVRTGGESGEDLRLQIDQSSLYCHRSCKVRGHRRSGHVRPGKGDQREDMAGIFS